MRGLIRSIEPRSAEADGDTLEQARAAAIAVIDMDGYRLAQTTALSGKATGESTVRAVAMPTASVEHEASGATYEAARDAFRASVPEGFEVLWATQVD